MLGGGLFLYLAYYGCDQIQAQRLLSAASVGETRRVLTLNGLLRFPLVFAYCLIGLGLAAYALQHPDFTASLPTTATGEPNYNLAFPAFVQREFAPGAAGLAMVGLFAAAMSSIDSALNSLSASTVEDFIARFRPPLGERRLFLYARLTTLFWGGFAIALSYQVEHIAPTVLEAINKIGSMANGPLLALFAIAVLAPGAGQTPAIAGFAAGLVANAAVAIWLPQVSWLWWNVIGCAVAGSSALLLARAGRRPLRRHGHDLQLPARSAAPLLAMAALILAVCLGLQLSGG